MKFKIWMETEASMGSQMPDMLAAMSPNKGSETVASNKVKTTGLQPQVDSQEIHTKQKDEQDKILAIDGAMERFDKEIPQGKDDSEKVNKARSLWEKFKEKWDEIKNQGLGDPDEIENPNDTPEPKQFPNGAIGIS